MNADAKLLPQKITVTAAEVATYRDAARYRHLRRRGLVWADAAFMNGENDGFLGHRQVGGELADAFCDFDMKRHEGR